MLSVCIPVYNYDVCPLVHHLVQQTINTNHLVEIIVMDDASIPEYININTKIEKYNNVSFIKLRDNVGRSCIRNLLASKATYNYILFLDGDSSIKPDFLDRYIKAIETDSHVICGGTIYTDTCPDPHKMLHWKAGKFRESHSVEQRIKKHISKFDFQ